MNSSCVAQPWENLNSTQNSCSFVGNFLGFYTPITHHSYTGIGGIIVVVIHSNLNLFI